MRNSSLVKWVRAYNLTGLKPVTEAAGQSRKGLTVGERSVLGEGRPRGLLDDTEVMMSARVAKKHVRNMFAENLRFPGEG